MIVKRITAICLLYSLFATAQPPQRFTERMIDRCAQDGRYFEAWQNPMDRPIVAEHDGISVQIERSKTDTDNASITFLRDGKPQITEKQDGFEAGNGWLTTSRKVGFTITWNYSASASETRLFRITSADDFREDKQLIPHIESIFTQNVKRMGICKNPGTNTTAIKWIDDTHLLVSINAWLSGFCYSNFTEGFILDVPNRTVTKILTEQQLINLPAVCTWNIVPSNKH